MQYRPSADELLVALAQLLDDVVLPALPPGLQHQARVGANIARILEREQRLSPDAEQREAHLLSTLLDSDGDAAQLSGMLAERLRASDDPDFDRAAWDVLVAVTRDELAIAKPGYDAWEGE
jgi:hypothetical protein